MKSKLSETLKKYGIDNFLNGKLEFDEFTEEVYQSVLDEVIGEMKNTMQDNHTLWEITRNEHRRQLRQKWAEFCGKELK